MRRPLIVSGTVPAERPGLATLLRKHAHGPPSTHLLKEPEAKLSVGRRPFFPALSASFCRCLAASFALTLSARCNLAAWLASELLLGVLEKLSVDMLALANSLPRPNLSM